MLKNGPICTGIAKRSQLSVQRWMAEVEKVLNSHEEFRLDESFHVMMEYADIPRGSCSHKVPKFFREKLKCSKCVIRVKNKDQICLARALILGAAQADGAVEKDKRRRKKALSNLRSEKRLKQEAHQLLEAAGIPIREWSLHDLPAFKSVRDIVTSVALFLFLIHFFPCRLSKTMKSGSSVQIT